MKRNMRNSFALLAGLMMVCIPVLAHHGGSVYDREHLITLKGTVTEFYWANPHPQIFVDVKDDSGKVVNWGVEALAPAILRRAGWVPTTLKPGDPITLEVFPSKKGTPIALLQKATFPDGRTLTGGHLGEE
jgi:hypothetical protein